MSAYLLLLLSPPWASGSTAPASDSLISPWSMVVLRADLAGLAADDPGRPLILGALNNANVGEAGSKPSSDCISAKDLG